MKATFNFNETAFNTVVAKEMAKHNAPENTNEEDSVCVCIPPKKMQGHTILSKAEIYAKAKYAREVEKQIETARQ
jgi:hypothetical protein